MLLYHGTKRANLKSILEAGIKARYECQEYSGLTDEEAKADGYRKGVWAYGPRDVKLCYGDAVLELDVPKQWVTRDGDEFVIGNDIPAHMIKHVLKED